MFPGLVPPPSSPNAKIGFSTFAMWGVCIVVLGICYKFEQNDASRAKPNPLPADVDRVLPTGMWLMSARAHPDARLRLYLRLARRARSRGRRRLDKTKLCGRRTEAVMRRTARCC